MQLVAYGAQDIYLTDSSYKTYKRHIQVEDVFKYTLARKYENFNIICDNRVEDKLDENADFFSQNELYQCQIYFNNLNEKALLTIKEKPRRRKEKDKKKNFFFNNDLSSKHSLAVNKLGKVENTALKVAQQFQQKMTKAQLRICRR